MVNPTKPEHLSGKRQPEADEVTSYDFLKKRLYDKPQLYERSFQRIKPHLPLLGGFGSLKDLKTYLRTQPDRSFQRTLKTDLKDLDKQHPELFGAIVEVLMFVLWDKLVEDYGTEERFADAYWDLICELKPDELTAKSLPGPEPGYEPTVPPAVPEANKGIPAIPHKCGMSCDSISGGISTDWNYMGSNVLSKAVEKGALTQPEAEAVMERAVYDRSFTYIGKAMGIPPEEAFNLYEQAMPKLRKWAEHAVLVMPGGYIICD
jgi:hypothetical protein